MRRALVRTSGVAIGTLWLAACAVGPDYVRPTSDVSDPYVSQRLLDDRESAPPVALTAWWDGFGDPLLTQLVAQALEQNLTLAQAIARISQSQAKLGAATSAMLPSATVSGEASRARASEETPTGRLFAGTPGASRYGSEYEANLLASWEIDLFGGLRRDREAALAELEATQAAAVAVRLEIAARAADLYVMARGLQARLAIAREQVDTQRHLLHVVQLQFDAGIAAELQLRQAQGVLAQVESAIPELEHGYDAATNALDVLLAQQPGTVRDQLSTTHPIPAAPQVANIGGPADLIRRRPDLIAAERRLSASNARIGAAIAEYYPSFSLGGLLGTASTVSGHLFDDSATQARAFVGLRWRLFDFGRIDAEILSARGSNAELLAAYRLSVLQASAEVEDALSALARREQQERILADGERAFVRARDTSLSAYKAGAVSLVEVLDADSRLLATRDARARAQTEATRAAIASFRALGGGWDPET
ncbi:NodT family efflux transporter outer membrane factor (OMF) lipoprotein [Panacagrimonas perspica]|uniref:NodT family efflux transporter outer membrane factor (OMF) lipoprotein n=1 Tax=Panacagrimonas perspica TaxID=381431 RepID=A0A4R7PED9_9GAMM|nr:efflux transporter outer membrane subunit [Panacagrimonas perspica]TDU32575.1 NodT family efflux transporter outer membrane factor (OMF) lipoprotein [Panacagrimonas perspica]THD05472.1 RND transporter [Panacagrimonas perspica]